MTRNQLDQETSPYLLQHRSNPVHWRAWGQAALAEAADQDKPILLSVGYAACHWCHVMAHESFEDETTARLMNDLFIPVKVDREERPDLDIIYQSALAALGQHGGWPLTMFLTPRGEPFWGGTYFPPAPAFGRPSFRDVLLGVADAYRHKPETVSENARALIQALTAQTRPPAGHAPSVELLDTVAQAVLRVVDPVHGGLSGTPKFPHLPLFTLLWRAGRRTGRQDLCDAVTVTLDHISQGGIYDHLGGGYARYATDEAWLVPHFEKMLYDNAQMIDLLTLVWQTTHSPLYAERVSETIGWLRREMIAEAGAFAATLDADSDGQEGRYYTWQADEIDRLLPSGVAEDFKRVYGASAAGNWEGVTILHRNHSDSHFADSAVLAAARDRLLIHRRSRVPPGRDDKVLADWNGMMIAALANAALVFHRSDWLGLAERAFAGIAAAMSRDDRLSHSLCRGRRQPAVLDDYAHMARAALLLYETTGRADYLERAAAWTHTADRHFWDEASGGYFFTADDSDDVIVRTKSAEDHSTPSGNGVMVEVLARLSCHAGEPAYRQRAEAVTTAFCGELSTGFTSMATLLNAWELLADPVQLTILGPADDAGRHALLRAVADTSLPTRVLSLVVPGQALPAGHPAAAVAAARANGPATALLCRASTCLPPIAAPDVLRATLAAQ